MTAGVDWPRVGAAALSLGGTSCLMVLLRATHPPAGATALIVSLGLMPRLDQMPILLMAVLLLLAQAFVMNRMAGMPIPCGRRRGDDRKMVLSSPGAEGAPLGQPPKTGPDQARLELEGVRAVLVHGHVPLAH